MGEYDDPDPLQIARLAAIKRRFDEQTFAQLERGYSVASWVVGAVKAVVLVTVLITGGVIRDQFKNSRQDERLDSLEATRTERNKEIATLSAGVADYKRHEPDIDNIIELRNSGRSFKEWYMQRYNQVPPGQDSSETFPSPHK